MESGIRIEGAWRGVGRLIFFYVLVLAIVSAALLVKSSTNSQSWERPGCHRVGHVREISIAGCLKFNISTNACRGQCFSYSVPALEELDTGPADQAGSGAASGAQSQPGAGAGTFNLEGNIAAVATPKSGENSPEVAASPFGDPSSQGGRLQQAAGQADGSLMLQAAQQSLPVAGAAGSGATEPLRRDVVSVSQCCNMMETEDIIVNVRCKSNEIRRLVFKSAKTCECFFCKHL